MTTTRHDAVISIRVSRELRGEIQRLAREAGLDASSWLRLLVERERREEGRRDHGCPSPEELARAAR